MLILFDIDGTLLLTRGAGIYALTTALREAYDHETLSAEGVDTAGRLDPLIVDDVLRANGLDPDAARFGRFAERYAHHLGATLNAGNVERLPGALELVETLRAQEAALGLLTGNLPETGRLKIAAAGFDPTWFPVGAWGVDGAHRRDLPPVAVDRHHALTGVRKRFDEVLIIGDTPHDVDCAKAHGCRCLAVTTGKYAAAELSEADRVVDSLAATDDLAAWMGALATR